MQQNIKFPPIKRIREITALKEEEATSSQAPSTSKDSEKRSKNQQKDLKRKKSQKKPIPTNLKPNSIIVTHGQHHAGDERFVSQFDVVNNQITIGDEVHSFNKVILDTDRNSIYTSEIEPMVLNFIQTDKNNTVITYGVTGSDKSTLMGAIENCVDGLIPKCFNTLYNSLQFRLQSIKFKIEVFELIAGDIDNLATKTINNKDSKLTPTDKNECETEQEALKYFSDAIKNRKVNAHCDNGFSSGAHAMIIISKIKIEINENLEPVDIIVNKMFFFDLCGQENGNKTGLKDCPKINTDLIEVGLLFRGNLIGVASAKSKIVEALIEALTDNSLLIVVCSLKPCQFGSSNTLIKFASEFYSEVALNHIENINEKKQFKLECESFKTFVSNMRNKIKEKKQSMKQQKQKIKAKFPDSFREDENEEDETLRQENQPALVENPLVVPALVETPLVETPLVDQVIPIQLNLDVPLMLQMLELTLDQFPRTNQFEHMFNWKLPEPYRHLFQNPYPFSNEQFKFCYEAFEKILENRNIRVKIKGPSNLFGCSRKWGCSITMQCPNPCKRYFLARFSMNGDAVIEEKLRCVATCVNIVGEISNCEHCNFQSNSRHGLLTHIGIVHRRNVN